MSSTKRTLQESEIINDETFNIDQPAAKKQKQSGVFNPDALIATQLQNEHNDITMEKANEPHVTKVTFIKNCFSTIKSLCMCSAADCIDIQYTIYS